MKQKKIFTIGLAVIGGLLLNTALYAGNDSFTKVMAKNRAKRGSAGSSYVEVNGNDEFKAAAKSGKLDSRMNTRTRKSKFIYKEVKNVHLNKNDLKDLGDDKTMNIGLMIEEKGHAHVSHGLNLKNSRLSTDRRINAGVRSTARDSSDITSTSSVHNTDLLGGQ